jgi:sulfate transport system permease protein
MAYAPAFGRARRQPSVIPGFGLTLGLTFAWLGLIVLIPVAGLFLKAASLGWADYIRVITEPRVLAALKFSFGGSLIAAAVNAVFGTIVAWVLVRYDFPLRRVVDAIVDIPFALPTAVAGISLTALFAPNGWVGGVFDKWDIQIAYTPVGVVLALIFIGLPFVVRTVQPVLIDLESEIEETAATLGATRAQTIVQVILPTLLPALLTGFALAFARAAGEYGSVIFIAGNLPMVSEIAPLLIVTRLQEFLYAEATAIATVMLIISFLVLLAINLLQRWAENRGWR